MRGNRAAEAAALRQEPLGVPGGAAHSALLGTENGAKLLRGDVQVVVRDHVVEQAVVLDLLTGDREAALYRFLVLAGPATQPRLEDLHAGRQDEDADGVGPSALDLARTLVIDVEDDAARGAGALDLGAARA